MPNEAHIIALAGNPNVGKSTVFNTLTGLRQHTGNWPGKTVAAARGDLTYGGEHFTLVDLPGTYSLFPNSAEEEIARDYLCSGEAEAVLILADATCLERSLNLVLQTLEAADVPAVVCVNLLDEAAKKGIVLDLPALSHALGAPVVGTAASCGEGLDKLRAALAAAVREKPRQRETAVEYPRAVERAVRVLEPALAPFAREQSRFYALRLLEDDALFFTRFGADLPALAAERIGEVCVRARAELDVAAHLVQIPVQIDRQLQLLRNFAVPRANRIKSLREVAAGRREAVALIKQIGHFDIGGSAFARRARHDNAPILVGKQNLPDLFELRRIGQRTSAKFCNFHTHSEALRFSSFSFSRRMGRKISQ